MRYLNLDLEFLINPECYHPMCSGCVNRIFNDGPNQCPYAECHRTLRRRGFRSAFFGDLGVEREVDIRRRVGAVFNKAEDDFVSLRDYNDYLYEVECLTDDLVNGGDEARKKAEVKLLEWEAQHKADIERNKRTGREAEETRKKRWAAEQEAAKRRRVEDLKAEEEDRIMSARLNEEMLDGLTRADDSAAQNVVKRIELIKRGQERRQREMITDDAPGLSIRGLKEKTKRPVEDDGPYDPFGGVDLTPSRFDLAKLGDYHNEWVDAARDKEYLRVGGYSADEYVPRALFDAFAGLGVFIGTEKDVSAVGTQGAAMRAGDGDVDMTDDVF